MHLREDNTVWYNGFEIGRVGQFATYNWYYSLQHTYPYKVGIYKARESAANALLIAHKNPRRKQ